MNSSCHSSVFLWLYSTVDQQDPFESFKTQKRNFSRHADHTTVRVWRLACLLLILNLEQGHRRVW
jgi:hypothetical protein